MSRKKLLLALGILVGAFAVAMAFSMNSNGEEAVDVETAELKPVKIVQTVAANGRIQPKTQVKISADVSAKIVRMDLKEGAWVEKGDFLLQLDSERYQALVEQAAANVRSAESDARLARENMVKAEKDYQRSKELFDKNLESQANLDQFYAAAKVEKARHASARDQVERARGALKQAKDDLSKTSIFAPMTGTISQLNKEEGEMALGSQFQEDVILIVSNLAGMEALVNVDENDIVNVAIGDSAEIEVDALPDVKLKGVVTEIANSATVAEHGGNEQKTEFEVKVAISKTHEKLRPGMTASSEIVTDTRSEAIGVPIQSVAVRTPEQLIEGDADSTAYQPDEDGFVEVVFLLSDDRVVARQVKTGIQSDSHIEIVNGLAQSDVIVTGNYRAISRDLKDGTLVAVKGD
ncbi:MAG: efflux RND transporter periplasmic adaptor subunit [Calditrichota bacterium]